MFPWCYVVICPIPQLKHSATDVDLLEGCPCFALHAQVQPRDSLWGSCQDLVMVAPEPESHSPQGIASQLVMYEQGHCHAGICSSLGRFLEHMEPSDCAKYLHTQLL